jgi:hypothetical protein
MLPLLAKFLRFAVLFLRTSFGVINNPYVTFRGLALKAEEIGETVFIYVLCFIYFVWVTLIRTVPRNPFVLSIKLNLLLLGAGIGIAGLLLVLYAMAHVVKNKGSLKTLFFLYSYTLLPTLFWFAVTSAMFLFFPPPRTPSIFGKALSVLYIAFSIAVLFWKLILYYLTLRFTFRMNMFGIIRVSFVAFPTVIVYAIIMYRFGIFRIPFL